MPRAIADAETPGKLRIAFADEISRLPPGELAALLKDLRAGGRQISGCAAAPVGRMDEIGDILRANLEPAEREALARRLLDSGLASEPSDPPR